MQDNIPTNTFDSEEKTDPPIRWRDKPRKHTLESMLAQCDFSLPLSEEEREWMNAPPVGREII